MEISPHILVVDDDSRLRELLRQFLSENGFSVSVAPDASHARRIMSGLDFDLIIMDVMMPGEDGYSFTRAIRETDSVPILMLTARGEVEDRISGLEHGVDDYLPKPFEPRELLLRIGSILKRAGAEPPRAPERELAFGECVFNSATGTLRRSGEIVHLTSVEESLLRVLAASNGNPVSREVLLEESDAEGGERTIDVQVTRLRRKIEPAPRWPRYLKTVRGQGYVLQTD